MKLMQKPLDKVKISHIATQRKFLDKFNAKKKVEVEKIWAKHMKILSFKVIHQPITIL